MPLPWSIIVLVFPGIILTVFQRQTTCFSRLFCLFFVFVVVQMIVQDQSTTEYKLDTFSAAYKKLTGTDVVFDFAVEG